MARDEPRDRDLEDERHQARVAGICCAEAMIQAFFGLLEELESEGYRLRGDSEEAILGYRPDVRPEMSMSDEQREEMNRRSIEAAQARLRNDREFTFGSVDRRQVLVSPVRPRP